MTFVKLSQNYRFFDVRLFHVLALDFSCLFRFTKVSHRFRYRNERKEEKKKHISRKPEKDKKYPHRIFPRYEVILKLSFTCTNAACPSRVIVKADTKSVGVISIALFHRKIQKINLRSEKNSTTENLSFH